MTLHKYDVIYFYTPDSECKINSLINLESFKKIQYINFNPYL